MTRTPTERIHFQKVKQHKRKHYLNIKRYTPKPCSCWMCGNPRKYFKELSIHEKSDKEFVASLDEL